MFAFCLHFYKIIYELRGDIFMKNLFLFLFLLFVVSCNTTKQMVIPSSTVKSSFTPLNMSESKSNFALAKIISDIDRGETIFAFPAQNKTKGTMCNYRTQGEITYAGGKQFLGDWSSELGEVFYETLTKMGYSVAGDPSDLFNQKTVANSAEFLIGARLLKMSGNFCHVHHWWDGRPLFKYSGELFVELEWSIFNTLTKDIIYKNKTSGYYKQNDPIKNGISVAFDNSFADAAEKFASSPEMRKLALGKTINNVEVKSGNKSILIVQGKKSKEFQLSEVQSKIVTIRIGRGHGSGFFVGDKGYILTNAHVVGKASKVRIATNQGLEIDAVVIGKNKTRDVALLKTELRNRNPIRINVNFPKVTEQVYAVGTPLKESLNTTVTKGIVSAFRKDKSSNLNFIQSDAAISPGNSGGPLFNNSGEVIGIAVAKYATSSSEGLNLFIPIKDALNVLNIDFKN